jgi:hypothetical protein
MPINLFSFSDVEATLKRSLLTNGRVDPPRRRDT